MTMPVISDTQAKQFADLITGDFILSFCNSHADEFAEFLKTEANNGDNGAALLLTKMVTGRESSQSTALQGVGQNTNCIEPRNTIPP